MPFLDDCEKQWTQNPLKIIKPAAAQVDLKTQK